MKTCCRAFRWHFLRSQSIKRVAGPTLFDATVRARLLPPSITATFDFGTAGKVCSADRDLPLIEGNVAAVIAPHPVERVRVGMGIAPGSIVIGRAIR